MRGIERLRCGNQHHKIALGKQIVSGPADKRRIHINRTKTQNSVSFQNAAILKSKFKPVTTYNSLENVWINQALCKSYLVYPTFQGINAIKHIHSTKTLLNQNFSSHKPSTSRDLELVKEANNDLIYSYLSRRTP